MGPEAHRNTCSSNAATGVSRKSHWPGLAWEPNSAPGGSREVLSEAPIPHQDRGEEARDLEFLTCLYQLQRPLQYLEVNSCRFQNCLLCSRLPLLQCKGSKALHVGKLKGFFRSSSIKGHLLRPPGLAPHIAQQFLQCGPWTSGSEARAQAGVLPSPECFCCPLASEPLPSATARHSNLPSGA